MAVRLKSQTGLRSVAIVTVSEPSGPKITILIVIIAALLVILGLKWIHDSFIIVGPPQGNERFGLAFISAADALADEARYRGALATGARWDRWPLYWHWVDAGGYVGPHRGGKHDYDTLVSQDLSHGLTPLVILMGTPSRYATQPSQVESSQLPERNLLPLKENPIPTSSATLPPRGLFEPIFAGGTDEAGPGQPVNPANPWAKFVFNTVERYRPGGLLARRQGWPRGVGVRYWEIWNEPDFSSFWSGTVEEYYRLLEVAYKSIKTADPEATVVLGGLAFYQKPNWLPLLLRQAQSESGRVYFDVLSLHHYWSIYNSEARLQQSRAALAAFGLTGLPIWITESGVSVWDDYPATAYDVPADEPWRATSAEQASYIIQHASLAFYNGVERYFHFMLHDDCGDGPSSAYGLRQNFSPHVCNPAQGKLRPAYAAYQLAAKQLAGLVPLWRQKTYEQDQVAFYRPGDRSRLVVMWATQGLTATATISATGSRAQLYWIDSQAVLSNTVGLSRTATLAPSGGVYTLTLPPATNRNSFQADDTAYHIGGRPYLLIEQDTLPPRSTLNPLPAASPPNFVVAWAGADSGSGVAGYEVWVSENGGPLRRWLAETTATQARYTGRIGQTYGFAVRARDRAGNLEPPPLQPQTITRVAAGPTVAGRVLGPQGEPVPGAMVTITGPHTQEHLTTGQDGAWPPLALPAGEYTFQASAPAYAAWPAPQQVDIELPTAITLTLAPLANQVASGDFEGDQVWAVWDWSGQVNLSIEAFDGQAAVRLGEGAGEPVTCPHNGQPGQLWAVRQSVSVPPEAAPALSFLYRISGPQPPPAGSGLEVAFVRGAQVQELVAAGELQPASQWRLASVDLSAWRGQSGEVRFQVRRCSDQPFSVTLDRVSLGPGFVR